MKKRIKREAGNLTVLTNNLSRRKNRFKYVNLGFVIQGLILSIKML